MDKILQNIHQDLKKLGSPKKAEVLQRFFKTEKGEYGEGDKFLGVVVPDTRRLVKKYWSSIPLSQCLKLLQSPWHEERLCALLLMVEKFQHFPAEQEKIFQAYLHNTQYINNWDLVDLSASKIVGAFLRNRNKSILDKLVKSKSLWERRIAMLATFDFLYNKDPDYTFRLARVLLKDSEDLIHKATGWMLREAGKRCEEKKLLRFLDLYSEKMPRTMLRYSIERLGEKLRKKYLYGF